MNTNLKVLYVACRWDPRIQDEYSGNDFGAYNAIMRQPGVELKLIGPFDFPPTFFERVWLKLHSLLTKKRPIKYTISYLKKSAKVVEKTIQCFKPDIVFSKYSAPFVFTDFKTPFIYMCDSTVKMTRELWPDFTDLAFSIMERWEYKVIQACDRVVTFSQSNADIISREYHKPANQVDVFPIPAYIPPAFLPKSSEIEKEIGDKLHILLVGKRYHLRGVDIAIDTVNLLNTQGIPSELRVVGMQGQDAQYVRFMGVYQKEVLQEMKAYFDQYRWADLLIHPSRFHSAGIVIGEAASFGVPCLTNNVGGLNTTVSDGISGFVLPAGSQAAAYAETISNLLRDPLAYAMLRKSTRGRYDKQLNWQVAGDVLFDIIKQVAKGTNDN